MRDGAGVGERQEVDMAKRDAPRLGKGLSGLLNTKPQPIREAPDTSATSGARANVEADPSITRTNRGLPSRDSGVGADDGSSVGGAERLLRLPLDDIRPNARQPRRGFDDDALDGLAASIRQSGVIQPVVVRRAAGSNGSGVAYELVAGERRCRAARRAELTDIPAIVVDISDEEAGAWALVENLQREQLDPIERASGFAALRDEFGLTAGEIAEQVGMNRSSVANFIRLLELEPEIRAMLSSGEGAGLTAGHGKALLTLAAGEPRLELAREAAAGGWSVRRLEHAVAASADESARGGATRDKVKRDEDPQLRDVSDQLTEHLKTKVVVQAARDRSSGRVVIHFSGVDGFEAVVERLGVRLNSS